jgi:hypothetical protein
MSFKLFLQSAGLLVRRKIRLIKPWMRPLSAPGGWAEWGGLQVDIEGFFKDDRLKVRVIKADSHV